MVLICFYSFSFLFLKIDKVYSGRNHTFHGWLSAKLTVHSYRQGGYLIHSELNVKALSLFFALKTSVDMQQRRYLGHHLPKKLRSMVSISARCSPDPFHEHPHFPCKTARPTVNGPSSSVSTFSNPHLTGRTVSPDTSPTYELTYEKTYSHVNCNSSSK